MAHQPLNVVITGASAGVGLATAEAFAARGAKLVLAARGKKALQDAVRRCRRAGGEAIAVPTDVTDVASVADLATQARKFLGTIDLWFSNVGVGAVGKYHEVPMEAHEQVLRANLIGHMNDAHAVLPIFIAQRFGTLVNMNSAGGYVAAPYGASYSASKFGLRGLSQALRAEFSGYPDIHICDVYPIFMDTPGVMHAANHTGKRLSVPPPVIDPRRTAEAVVRLAHHPHNTTGVGAPGFLFNLAQAFVPNLAPRLMKLVFDAYFAKAEPQRLTNGNLFDPSSQGGSIDGGLRSTKQRGIAALAVVSAGVAAFVIGTAMFKDRQGTRNRRLHD